MKHGLVAMIGLAACLGLAQSAIAQEATINFSCSTPFNSVYPQGTAGVSNVCPSNHVNPGSYTIVDFTSWTQDSFTLNFTSGSADVNGVNSANGTKSYNSMDWQNTYGFAAPTPPSGPQPAGTQPNLANPISGWSQTIITDDVSNQPFQLKDFYVGESSGTVSGTVYAWDGNTEVYSYTIPSITVPAGTAPCTASVTNCFVLISLPAPDNTDSAWTKIVIDLDTSGYGKIDDIQLTVPEGGAAGLYLLLVGSVCFGGMFLNLRNRLNSRA